MAACVYFARQSFAFLATSLDTLVFLMDTKRASTGLHPGGAVTGRKGPLALSSPQLAGFGALFDVFFGARTRIVWRVRTVKARRVR